ncbi:MAG TPA: outer-membrane lipoprotein carrier protein LolA [Devosiaceae bacterium]
MSANRLLVLFALGSILAVPALAQEDAAPIPMPPQSATPDSSGFPPVPTTNAPNVWPDGTPIDGAPVPATDPSAAPDATAVPPASSMPVLPLDHVLTPEDKQLIADIGAHNSAIKTMTGRFEQINGDGSRIQGTFYLDRPDKIRFRYDPPSREEIISVGRGFYVINRKDRTKYAYPQDMVPLREFLTDKIDLFSANIVDVVSSEAFMSITIRDQTPMGPVDVALIFDKQTKDLRQWTIANSDGSQITFSIYDVTTGVDIPKSYFYLDPTYTAVQQ